MRAGAEHMKWLWEKVRAYMGSVNFKDRRG